MRPGTVVEVLDLTSLGSQWISREESFEELVKVPLVIDALGVEVSRLI